MAQRCQCERLRASSVLRGPGRVTPRVFLVFAAIEKLTGESCCDSMTHWPRQTRPPKISFERLLNGFATGSRPKPCQGCCCKGKHQPRRFSFAAKWLSIRDNAFLSESSMKLAAAPGRSWRPLSPSPLPPPGVSGRYCSLCDFAR